MTLFKKENKKDKEIKALIKEIRRLRKLALSLQERYMWATSRIKDLEKALEIQ